MKRLALFALSSFASILFAAGCSGGEASVASGEDDLTSVTARSRTLEFEGVVYANVDVGDEYIKRLVREQTQTAFGPLRTGNIAANSRELKDVDPKTFKKREVSVVDENGASKPMLEVRYIYRDNAVVAAELSRRSAIPLALMRTGYKSETERILKECTPNTKEVREFADTVWYEFNPSLPSCKKAIKAEQEMVAAASKGIKGEKVVSAAEVNRLYRPITAHLGPDTTAKGKTYPDYQRLFSGGVKKDALVVSLVYGLIDHDDAKAAGEDSGYGEFIDNMRVLMFEHPGFELVNVSPSADLTSFTLASGKKVSGVTFANIISAANGEATLGLSAADRRDLHMKAADRLAEKWLTFRLPVTVTLNGETRDFAVEILTYFGAGENPTPHKHAIKNSDVFIYNGHSYIGYGPLDPSRFTKSDFPSSYQILFVDGCVSYNYYEKDYIPLKEGGTKNLDLITNGIEAPAYQSGYALGRFVSTLIDGSASYRDLLLAAEATDSLRVVDGELDNEFSPDKFSLTVQPK